MNFDDLTPEQIEKAKSCKSNEELIALAESEGIELNEEQLETLSGGGGAWNSVRTCNVLQPQNSSEK